MGKLNPEISKCVLVSLSTARGSHVIPLAIIIWVQCYPGTMSSRKTSCFGNSLLFFFFFFFSCFAVFLPLNQKEGVWNQATLWVKLPSNRRFCFRFLSEHHGARPFKLCWSYWVFELEKLEKMCFVWEFAKCFLVQKRSKVNDINLCFTLLNVFLRKDFYRAQTATIAWI